MVRKLSIFIFVTVILASVLFAQAQQPKKVARIGVLSQSNANFMSTQLEAFRQGLRAFGYAEGQNIAIEYRYAENSIGCPILPLNSFGSKSTLSPLRLHLRFWLRRIRPKRFQLSSIHSAIQ